MASWLADWLAGWLTHSLTYTEVKVTPTLKEIKDYWNDIWGTTGDFNNSPEWLNVLEKEYCDKIQPEDYNINTDKLQTAIKRLQDNKSPGNDLIVGTGAKI